MTRVTYSTSWSHGTYVAILDEMVVIVNAVLCRVFILSNGKTEV